MRNIRLLSSSLPDRYFIFVLISYLTYSCVPDFEGNTVLFVYFFFLAGVFPLFSFSEHSGPLGGLRYLAKILRAISRFYFYLIFPPYCVSF